MPNSKLRVLPLGGLGEIGKNMTVVEYDGAIVVVDTGLRFPTAEQVGIDLVLPDFTYLRERAEDIEGIVITHGHEDHLGALPWILRELGTDIPVFGGPLALSVPGSAPDDGRVVVLAIGDIPLRRLMWTGVLILSGAAMAGHYHRWSDSTLQVKLGLVALVAVLIGLHMRRPEWHVLDASIFAVSLAIVWLGIVVAG